MKPSRSMPLDSLQTPAVRVRSNPQQPPLSVAQPAPPPHHLTTPARQSRWLWPAWLLSGPWLYVAGGLPWLRPHLINWLNRTARFHLLKLWLINHLTIMIILAVIAGGGFIVHEGLRSAATGRLIRQRLQLVRRRGEMLRNLEVTILSFILSSWLAALLTLALLTVTSWGVLHLVVTPGASQLNVYVSYLVVIVGLFFCVIVVGWWQLMRCVQVLTARNLAVCAWRSLGMTLRHLLAVSWAASGGAVIVVTGWLLSTAIVGSEWIYLSSTQNQWLKFAVIGLAMLALSLVAVMGLKLQLNWWSNRYTALVRRRPLEQTSRFAGPADNAGTGWRLAVVGLELAGLITAFVLVRTPLKNQLTQDWHTIRPQLMMLRQRHWH